ncbi:hypothetical protein VKT23_009897 [Stygiomarasmius scandens]|uniref:Uncharacterized protein n=1 Tax=Marasmiellus scandens TaxID=2682957 RepID=A0ABR1JEA7_9AGAR
MRGTDPKKVNQIRDVFSKWIREQVEDQDVESANAAPEWINVQYPGGDDSAYPLITKRPEDATHQNLKDSLRNYMTAVARYYGRAVFPWNKYSMKDLSIFTKDSFFEGLVLGDPSRLGMPLNEMWWDVIFERQKYDRPIKFRNGEPSTEKPSKSSREAGLSDKEKQGKRNTQGTTRDASSGKGRKQRKGKTNETNDGQTSSLKGAQAVETTEETENMPSSLQETRPSSGALHKPRKLKKKTTSRGDDVVKQSQIQHFEEDDEPEPTMEQLANKSSSNALHMPRKTVPTYIDISASSSSDTPRVQFDDSEDDRNALLTSQEKVHSKRRRDSAGDEGPVTKKPTPASEVSAPFDDRSSVQPVRRSQRAAHAPPRADETVKSKVPITSRSSGIMKWNIETLQSLILECGWAQYIYQSMPDKPDWKRSLHKWVLAEGRLHYTEEAERPQRLDNMPAAMKAWVDFKSKEENRWQEYFVPEDVFLQPNTIEESQAWIAKLHLGNVSRLDADNIKEVVWIQRGGRGIAHVFFAFNVWGRSLVKQGKVSPADLDTFRTEFSRFDRICDTWYSTV